MNASFISAIATFALLWFGAYCWLVLWRDYFVSVYRQKLFEVRDELFDAAVRGEIEFSAPEYLAMRDLINGNIRFAHEFTPSRLLLFVYKHVRRGGDIPQDDKLVQAEQNYPDIYDKMMSTAVGATVEFLFESSLVLRPVYALAALVVDVKSALAMKIEPVMDDISAAGDRLKTA